jgi:hypothetical protein
LIRLLPDHSTPPASLAGFFYTIPKPRAHCFRKI